MKHIYKTHVKYSHVEMDGLVRNPQYLQYFQDAVFDLYEQNELPFSQCQKDGVLFPTIETKFKVIKPLIHEDNIEIELVVKKLKNFGAHIYYSIMKEGIIVCEGYTRHAFVSRSSLDFIELPGKYRELLEKYLEV